MFAELLKDSTEINDLQLHSLVLRDWGQTVDNVALAQYLVTAATAIPSITFHIAGLRFTQGCIVDTNLHLYLHYSKKDTFPFTIF